MEEYDYLITPTNLEVIFAVFTENDFDYFFRKSAVDPSDFLKAISVYPSFCGELAAETQDIFEVCKKELVLFFTYLLKAEKVEDVCNDLSDYDTCYPDNLFIQQVFATHMDDSCLKVPGCSDHDDSDPITIYPKAEGESYYPRGAGPEPLEGESAY